VRRRLAAIAGATLSHSLPGALSGPVEVLGKSMLTGVRSAAAGHQLQGRHSRAPVEVEAEDDQGAGTKGH